MLDPQNLDSRYNWNSVLFDQHLPISPSPWQPPLYSPTCRSQPHGTAGPERAHVCEFCVTSGSTTAELCHLGEVDTVCELQISHFFTGDNTCLTEF